MRNCLLSCVVSTNVRRPDHICLTHIQQFIIRRKRLMRRALNICGIVCTTIISVQLLAGAVFAQQDKLVGRWEGKVQSPQGERDTSLVIKKEGDVYTGVMPGMRQGMEIQLKDFKINGDKITAKADVETPQATITINYSFTLAGETLKGQGALDFGGQGITLDFDLKRASATATASTASSGRQPGGEGDKLAGRWEGKVQSPQGERDASLVIKKEGGVYTGQMPGMQGREILIKDFKIDGDNVTAKADVEAPQGSITINYTFKVTGETMKGQGALDFGGQSITFDLDLKRVSAGAAAPAASSGQQAPSQGQAQGPGQGQGTQRQRTDRPQPQQKQSIDYFVGQWSYKYIGRESPLWPAPRECVVTFTKRADGKSVDGVSECKHEGGAFKDNLAIVFDEATKTLSFTEKLGSGVALTSKGDWTSPISIRFTIDPVTAKKQKLQLRRTISVVAAHSFTVAEELSEDGGPFVRLGSAVFSKIGMK